MVAGGKKAVWAHMRFKENGAYMKLSNICSFYTMPASIESRSGNSARRLSYSIHVSPKMPWSTRNEVPRWQAW